MLPETPEVLGQENYDRQYGNNNVTPEQVRDYSSFGGDWLAYLNYMADRGDPASLDKLLNYLMSEHSSNIARNWTANREDTSYQRLVEDMRKAGINPYALLQGIGSPISSGSAGNSYSGSNYSTYAINKESNKLKSEQNDQNWLKISLSLIPFFLAIIAVGAGL